MDRTVFRIAKGSSAARWFCGVIGALILAPGGFIGTMAFLGSRIVTLEVSDRGLAIHGDIYGRDIPRDALHAGQARALDVAVESGYAPTSRTNGTGLPNYQSGWFRLANGSIALLFVTDWSRAVLVPTAERFDLLISPVGPEAFLAALKAMVHCPA